MVQGSQTSKTEGVLLCTIGYFAMYSPKTSVFYLPTEELSKKMSERIHQLFYSVPEIYQGLDKRHTQFCYTVNGAPLYLGWTGSASQVSSVSAEWVFIDEIDRMTEIKGEGHPWALGKVRTSTYLNSKLIGTSSPTLGNIVDYRHPDTGLIHWQVAHAENIPSFSWQLWQEGTRGEFMLPCPQCSQYFAPKSKLLFVPSTDSEDKVRSEARLICPHCGENIQFNHQYSMIAAGVMVHPGQRVVAGQAVGEIPEKTTMSFHVNGLCSPWVTWADRTVALWRVMRSGHKGRIQSVVNVEFGEVYGEQGEAPAWEALAEQRHESKYQMGEIPPTVQVLTAGVDVQRDRLVVVIMGWGMRDGQLEGYVIQHDELLGKTQYDDVWDLLQATYLDRSVGDLFIKEMGIDSGFNPSSLDRESHSRNIIYEFCRKNPRVSATKGASRSMTKPFSASKIDINHRGKQIKQGLTLWSLDTDFLKREVYLRLQWDLTRAGRWYYPTDLPLQFFKEVTAEQLTDTGHWITIGANHALDAVVINCFLAMKLRLKTTLSTTPRVVAPRDPVVQRTVGRQIQHGGEYY